ncbi:WhiB family transcriptional regulator [Streptomyces spiralis]
MPFRCSPTPTACRASPQTFVPRPRHRQGPRSMRPHRAKAACRRCLIATACLQWALSHPGLTPEGSWAATTARERALLRQRLTARFGKD